MIKPILTINQLSVSFQTTPRLQMAVDGIDLAVNEGEVLGLVGESGSGKSVTALSIMQLLPPSAKITSGSIFFAKPKTEPVDLCALNNKQLSGIRGKEIGMIFQEPMTSLNPVLKCGFQVAEALIQHFSITKNEATDRVIELFEKVEMKNAKSIFERYPNELSGGQKQRVMIAMALSCQPALLIADEPTTALDVTVQAEILKLLKRLQRESNMSLLFITHDLGVIGQMADRVSIMRQGTIVETDTTTNILQAPYHPYTKALIACRPSLSYKLRRLPTIAEFQESATSSNTADKNNVEAVINQLKLSDEELKSRADKILVQPNILEVKGLTVSFSRSNDWFTRSGSNFKAVNDISFGLKKGETLGLVGESGCGKTTLGKAMLKLINAQSGEVWFEGQNLMNLTGSQMLPVRKKMQMIFQDPYSTLNPRMTIGNAIQEALLVHNIVSNRRAAKERVLDLLIQVGLQTDYFDRYPHEFSGGQRQRISIARALSVEPELLICDECVSALDVSVQAQVLNLLLDLRIRYNFSCIFISHDLAVTKQIADRIMVMKDGCLEEIGTPEQIFDHPQTVYTQNLINSIIDERVVSKL